MAYYLQFDEAERRQVTFSGSPRQDVGDRLVLTYSLPVKTNYRPQFIYNNGINVGFESNSIAISTYWFPELILDDVPFSNGQTYPFAYDDEVHTLEVVFKRVRTSQIPSLGIDVSTGGYREIGMRVYRYQLIAADGTVKADYDPSASGGTGSILPDTVSGNDGTLVNFPTDNSQWVFYGAAGGVTGDAAFNLPKLTLSASGSATLPQPSANGAFSLQPITVSSTGSATLPQPITNGAFSLPILSASGSASATLPQPNAIGSFSYPLLTVSASGSATTTNADINGNITFNQLTVSGNASATLPQPDVIGAFSLPKLTIDGTASAIVPQPIINGNIALSKLTISASGAVTLPQPIANGAFNIPLATVKGFATISGLQLIIDRQTNINQQFLSANIEQEFLSANIKQKNLSNNFIYH